MAEAEQQSACAVPDSITFMVPKKEISMVSDMGKWKRSQMKTGPFAEHSNQLWNISAVPSWSKVNQGLIRMYKAECLEKFPVIQHFKFGSLLSIQPGKT
uniref:Serine/threonine-protein phosphatase 2A activator n=1 Tax=Gasterosteus aculeatus aculeatus TaxID=481459 RepID=A0AAQ4QF11_GASAC